ncbi:MAG TPA: class I SAM-dependent methyltransferase, partial [Candidatus Binataceae bacterium]|nr:class I SAM-dependent methyltransferase [Candidatus Binataceae bacterium]
MNERSPATQLDATSAAAPDATRTRSLRLARSLLTGLFRDFHQSLSVRLWRGEMFRVGGNPGNHADPEFNLIFRNAAVVCSLVLDRDPLRIADAYFRGDVDIEGDFRAALALRNHLQEIRLSWRDRLWAILAAIRLKLLSEADSNDAALPGPRRATLVKRHSKAENRDAVQFHYDLSNDFYSLWLDPALVYSCAYFETPEVDLESAQQAKLEHICRKLLLSPGERFLDVGCGWGALVIYAARHFGVRAHGITLSQQ